MKIIKHRQFVKSFEKRIANDPKLRIQFLVRYNLFIQDRQSPELYDHQLTGDKKNYRSFSITGDIRVVYQIEGDVVTFYDVGSHNQVY